MSAHVGIQTVNRLNVNYEVLAWLGQCTHVSQTSLQSAVLIRDPRVMKLIGSSLTGYKATMTANFTVTILSCFF